jgi:hypothetical protein
MKKEGKEKLMMEKGNREEAKKGARINKENKREK